MTRVMRPAGLVGSAMLQNMTTGGFAGDVGGQLVDPVQYRALAVGRVIREPDRVLAVGNANGRGHRDRLGRYTRSCRWSGSARAGIGGVDVRVGPMIRLRPMVWQTGRT